MNDSTQSRGNVLVSMCAIALFIGAMYWTTSSRADAPQAPTAVAVSAFEYYPAQFVNRATEPGDSIPTF